MIQPDMELSDSEDEGEGGRRNHQEHKTTRKTTTPGKTPEVDGSSSALPSGNAPPSKGSQAESTRATTETLLNAAINSAPNAGQGAREPEKNDSNVPMDIDSTLAQSN